MAPRALLAVVLVLLAHRALAVCESGVVFLCVPGSIQGCDPIATEQAFAAGVTVEPAPPSMPVFTGLGILFPGETGAMYTVTVRGYMQSVVTIDTDCTDAVVFLTPAVCTGDDNGNGVVTIDEILVAVNHAMQDDCHPVR